MIITKITAPKNYNYREAEKALKYFSRRYFGLLISRNNFNYKALRTRIETLAPEANLKKLLYMLFDSIQITSNGYVNIRNKKYLDKNLNIWYRLMKYGTLGTSKSNIIDDAIKKAAITVDKRRIGYGN